MNQGGRSQFGLRGIRWQYRAVADKPVTLLESFFSTQSSLGVLRLHTSRDELERALVMRFVGSAKRLRCVCPTSKHTSVNGRGLRLGNALLLQQSRSFSVAMNTCLCSGHFFSFFVVVPDIFYRFLVPFLSSIYLGVMSLV